MEFENEVIKDKKFRTFSFALSNKSAACGGWIKVMIEPVGK